MTRPSLAKRATVAVAVLGSFYATTLAIALVLVPPPVLAFLEMDRVRVWPLLLLTACCSITAYGLIRPARGTAFPVLVAAIEESLGERCRVFRLGSEAVRPGAIAADAMKNDVARRELARWTAFLANDVVQPREAAISPATFAASA